MEALEKLTAWLDSHRDAYMELLRFYLGFGLFIKGIYFLSNPAIITEMLGSKGFSVGLIVIGHYVALAHLLGGFMMAIGLLTRIAALLQLPILVGAVFLIHIQEGLFTKGQNLEFTALVLFALALIIANGSGRFSADYYIFQKKQEEE